MPGEGYLGGSYLGGLLAWLKPPAAAQITLAATPHTTISLNARPRTQITLAAAPHTDITLTAQPAATISLTVEES